MDQNTQQPSFVATHPWNDDKSKAILIDALRNPEENLKESISLEEHAQIGQILRSMQDQYVLSAVGYLARSVVADKVTHPEFNQMTDTAIKVFQACFAVAERQISTFSPEELAREMAKVDKSIYPSSVRPEHLSSDSSRLPLTTLRHGLVTISLALEAYRGIAKPTSKGGAAKQNVRQSFDNVDEDPSVKGLREQETFVAKAFLLSWYRLLLRSPSIETSTADMSVRQDLFDSSEIELGDDSLSDVQPVSSTLLRTFCTTEVCFLLGGQRKLAEDVINEICRHFPADYQKLEQRYHNLSQICLQREIMIENCTGVKSMLDVTSRIHGELIRVILQLKVARNGSSDRKEPAFSLLSFSLLGSVSEAAKAVYNYLF